MPCDIHGHCYTSTHLCPRAHIPNHAHVTLSSYTRKYITHGLYFLDRKHANNNKQEDRGRVGVGCGVWVWGGGVGDGAPAELLPRMPKPTARACRDGPCFYLTD